MIEIGDWKERTKKNINTWGNETRGKKKARTKTFLPWTVPNT